MHESTTKIIMVLFILISSMLCACTSSVDSKIAEVISVTHYSGGDAPIASTLVLQNDRSLNLQYPEGDRFECRVSEADYERLLQLIEATDWQVVGSDSEYRMHPDAELAVVRLAGASYYVLLEPADPALHPLFGLLDSVAIGGFGKHYDQPLLHWQP